MKAVILAGGLGKRLRPFTQVLPKPLLPVGESSVLELQILSLKKFGVQEIFIATNYLSDIVSAVLGDGSKYGISLTFSKEEKPLGTCGPVRLLQDKLTEPFLLLNGDILTTLKFDEAYQFALSKPDCALTVITKEITTPFDFGKVVTQGEYLLEVEEKPNFRLEILAGIYVLKPAVFDLIPHDTYYGIDTLIKDLLAREMPIGRYLMSDYWLDIGQIGDYQIAQDAYKEHFNHLRTNAPWTNEPEKHA